jgi:hypothetical protein
MLTLACPRSFSIAGDVSSALAVTRPFFGFIYLVYHEQGCQIYVPIFTGDLVLWETLRVRQIYRLRFLSMNGGKIFTQVRELSDSVGFGQ